MKPDGSRSRRDLIATVTGGALLGAMWGAAFPIVATERRPTIAVVGHNNVQVVLIDASTSRVLILSGEPDDELVNALPAMLTVFRQRIDLLIATPSALAERALDFVQRWRIRQTIALCGGTGSPSVPANHTLVDDGVDIALGTTMQLGVRMGFRDAWRSDATTTVSPLWCATLRTTAGNVVIAPDTASLIAVGPSASTLMIVPNAPAPEILSVFTASALAVNFDSDPLDAATASGNALTRVYPRDVARFVVDNGSLTLPEWTVTEGDGNRR